MGMHASCIKGEPSERLQPQGNIPKSQRETKCTASTLKKRKMGKIMKRAGLMEEKRREGGPHRGNGQMGGHPTVEDRGDPCPESERERASFRCPAFSARGFVKAGVALQQRLHPAPG